MANHRLLGIIGQIPFLVDVYGRAVAQRVCLRHELHRGRPERAGGIFYFDDLIIGNGGGQLQIKRIFDAQIIGDQRGGERTAFKPHRGDCHRLAVRGDGKSAGWRRGQLKI